MKRQWTVKEAVTALLAREPYRIFTLESDAKNYAATKKAVHELRDNGYAKVTSHGSTIYYTRRGDLEAMRKNPGKKAKKPPKQYCMWFAGCNNHATGVTPHKILGDVPTCDRCHKFATGEERVKKNPAHRWKGHRQSLVDRLIAHPEAKYRLAYSDPQYEKKRKTLTLLRKEGLVTLEFNFPKNDDIYYQATSKLTSKSARKNPRRKKAYANSPSDRKEFRRLSREAMRDARRWAKDHGKDEKYRAIIRRAREWSRETFARKNPAGGAYLAAKRGKEILYFTGKKFTASKKSAKVFASGERAMSKAHQLAMRFPVLADYVLFPERVRPKVEARRNPSGYRRAVDAYARELDEADERLNSFAGRSAREVLSIHEPQIKAGLVIGKLEGVMYRANRGDGDHNYFHRFKKNSRPLLISKHDGSQIGIVGGQYQFTERGIEDV